MGRVDITLSLGFFSNSLEMIGYITDASHLKLVEVDNALGVTSGIAIGQGAATGTFTQAGAFSNNYVFTAFGAGPTGQAALATAFTSNGAGQIQNGISDVSLAGVPSSGNLTGTYAVDNTGTGRVVVTLTGNNGTLSKFALYLSGGTDPAQVMEIDSKGVTAGFAYQQASGPFSAASFQGPYGLNFTVFAPNFAAEDDVTGQALADGAGNLSGAWDINANGAPMPNVSFTGTYAGNNTARFTGAMTTAPTGALQFSYYIVNASEVVFIETDSSGVTLGLLQLQTPPF
jgi:hypothetical protein